VGSELSAHPTTNWLISEFFRQVAAFARDEGPLVVHDFV
jgi:hypothetical protein